MEDIKFLTKNILKGLNTREGIINAKILFLSPRYLHIIYHGTNPELKTIVIKKNIARWLLYCTCVFDSVKAAIDVIRVASKVPNTVTIIETL
jgi:hypothetical protein